MKHRLISLILGFLLLYYALFAKHHHYDREMIAIHSDVENLMRQANATILRERLVEAEVPDIFKETHSAPPSTPPSSMLVKTRGTPPASLPSEGIAQRGKAKGTSSLISAPKLPLKEKKKRKKKKRKKLKSPKLKAGSGVSQRGMLNVTARTNLTHTLDGAKPNHVQRNASALILDAGKNVNATTMIPSPPQPSPLLDLNATVQTTNSSSGNGTSSSGVPTLGIKGQSPVSSNASAKVSDLEIDSPVAAAIPPSAVPAPRRRLKGPSMEQGATEAMSQGVLKPQEAYDYSAEFKDMDPKEVPESHVPVLDWNYQDVTNPQTSEQIFGLGNKLDHVAVYKPLCLDTTTGQALSFKGSQICSGFNRTEGWMVQYCNVMRESLVREYLLTVEPDKPKEWLTEQASKIHWIEGLTVLQILEKNCGNIAHFSGRALILQHIIENIAAYAAPPSRIENIIILPTFHIMKRFLYPHNYEFWHKSVFSALIAPAKFTIGTLGNFLYREQKIPYSGTPRVQLLHNFSLAGSIAADKQHVCFRRAIVPGYLKARFFVNDIEYPSKRPSLQSMATGAPVIPRDSLRFRERVSLQFGGTPSFPAMKKEIVLLDRKGSRRVLENATRPQILQMFEKVSKEKGYEFKVVSFDNMNFTQQYATMKTVAIAIGIHGANLVNTMFMPPLAVLIELFPFGFLHEMYVNGGNAGLKYFKYQMISGVPFPGPRQYRSVRQCIELNKECKVHYRDSVLKVMDADLSAMERILRQAIAWCDERPKPFSSMAEAQKAASKERRRRRLLYDVANWGTRRQNRMYRQSATRA